MAHILTYNWQIRGHQPQLALLDTAITGKRLAHAYIFTGPSQVGKRTVARKLGQILVCEVNSGCGECVQCKTFQAGSNADLIELSGDNGLKIEVVRDLSYKLSLKPYAAPFKIAIIDNAHNMTVEASNALLKSLEEPKPNTIIVLITDNASKLLPTIISRAQKISFGPLEGANEINSEDEEVYQRFYTGSTGEKLVLAQELAQQDAPDIKSTLESWLMRLGQELRLEPSQILAKKARAVMRAQKLLDQNVNSKLLLSDLMVNSN